MLRVDSRSDADPPRKERSVEVLAPAKVNLSLRVIGRRGDGYHLLDSCVAPVAIYDRLRVSIRFADVGQQISLSCSPSSAIPVGDSNLVVRATRLFLEEVRCNARVVVRLEKGIPVGAGLGGGSSDAAATLRALNFLSERPVPPGLLSEWALRLGADVPFFLTGGCARMRGIGERLEHLANPVPRDSALVVVYPGIPLETRHVYAMYDDLLTSADSASRVRGLTVGRGQSNPWLQNDLEASAFRILPIVDNLKRQLRALGAQGSLMTGSGSAVFGLWDSGERARAAAGQLRATGAWARATWILDKLPAVETCDADGGRSPSW